MSKNQFWGWLSCPEDSSFLFLDCSRMGLNNVGSWPVLSLMVSNDKQNIFIVIVIILLQLRDFWTLFTVEPLTKWEDYPSIRSPAVVGMFHTVSTPCITTSTFPSDRKPICSWTREPGQECSWSTVKPFIVIDWPRHFNSSGVDGGAFQIEGGLSDNSRSCFYLWRPEFNSLLWTISILLSKQSQKMDHFP